MPLIFAAMKMEAEAIRAALKDGGAEVEVQIIGISACRLPKSLNDLAAKKPSVIIMAGLAGALDPALTIGDIIFDDPAGLLGKPITGKIHTADSIIATPQHKAALFAQTGAAAVDMENATVRRAAEADGIPFLGIRAISDQASQAIDQAVIKLVDEIGQPKPMAIASLLMRRPGIIAELRQLQRQGELATAALGKAVVRALVALRGK